MALDKKSCGKEKGCLWCEGSFGPASCYDEVSAMVLIAELQSSLESFKRP